MSELSDFAINDRQREVLSMQAKGMSYPQIGKELGITSNQVDRALRTVRGRAARMGHSPEHDMTHSVPEGFRLKGTSTLYDEDGNAKMQWVKTTADQDQLVRLAEQLAESVGETVTPIKPRKPAKIARDPDKMVVYPLPDLHIGMYAGVDGEKQWGSAKAEEVITQKFDEILQGSPSTETALIPNLGDFFHTDNFESVTGGHGHSLDTSERWSESVKIGFRMFRKMIDSALLKHSSVRVICASGNHDVHSSVLLATALDALYSNEERCDVETAATPFHFHEFGKCLMGVTHGHKVKPNALYHVMCEDMREAWGRCEHFHWFTGHIHTQRLVEIGGQKIETFRAPIPGDAYSHGNGYRSPHGLQSVTFHKEDGEVNRSIAMM